MPTALRGTLGEKDWSRQTPFLRWTPWDVLAHLHFFDRVSLLSLTDAEAFAAERKAVIQAVATGRSGAEVTREKLGHLGNAALLETWRTTCHEMAQQLGASDPSRRLPWFGPDMGVRMFTTARYMETWAHGQDVYDLMRVPRTHTDRIRNIAVALCGSPGSWLNGQVSAARSRTAARVSFGTSRVAAATSRVAS